MEKGNQVCVGKDGFIASRRVVETIIREVPDMVIGAPCWDDGLLVWCWKKYGPSKVELRYGDVWHVQHPTAWRFEESDAVFNENQLTSVGITTSLRYSIDWGDVSKRILPKRNECKILGIIQPGRIGDIIIVLPIAKWYYDLGYKIVWPVCSQFLPLFDYVGYVEPIDIGLDIGTSYRASYAALNGIKPDKILDLGIGFGRDESGWVNSGLHFNEWKYHAASVPQEERFNLQIVRDFVKEKRLWEVSKELYNLNGNKEHVVIHDEGTKGPYRFGFDGIRIKPIEGFSIFDWIGIIENAKHLYCVDSCISNLADQLKLCEGRRSVWFWKDIPDQNPKRRSLGFPKLCDDWEVL